MFHILKSDDKIVDFLYCWFADFCHSCTIHPLFKPTVCKGHEKEAEFGIEER